MRMRVIGIVGAGMLVLMTGAALASADPSPDKKATAISTDKSSDKRNQDVIAMAQEFGLIIGPVTEDIRKELNLQSAEGVAVFEIIGDSRAERAGIKVGAIIAEINKKPVKNLDDFGRLLAEVLKEGNFTVGTWEPTSPENQGIGQQMNFHFVSKSTD